MRSFWDLFLVVTYIQLLILIIRSMFQNFVSVGTGHTGFKNLEDVDRVKRGGGGGRGDYRMLYV